MYKLNPAEQAEKNLFFRPIGEAVERCGAIGYLRADFSTSGRSFFSTWFDTQPHLRTIHFKHEFDNVINSLRDDGKEPPFASRKNLEAFCAVNSGLKIQGNGDGYKIQTLDFSYYTHCLSRSSDYDIYCYVYDNRWLLPELAGQHELPEKCFSTLPSSGELIYLYRNEKGYRPCDASKPNPEENRFFADTSNKIHGITRGQEEAMMAGSLFGWDTPAAKPWMYDQNGNPRMKQPKNKDKER